MRRRERRFAAACVGLGLVLGLAGGAWAAFSSTTANSGNSFSSAADWEPPTVVRTTIAKTPGYLAGKIKQAGSYFVYAQVTDGGNPASGVATVTANVSSLTTGATAAALASGSFSVNGVSYNYRSASQTAKTPLAAGSYTYSLTVADGVPNSQTVSGFPVTVDNTAPSGSDIQTANASGGTVGKAETNDTITYTFSEQIDPESILSGWTGTATTVRVVFANNNCTGSNDSFTIQNSGGTSTLPFGTICLSGNNYVSGARTITGSTMTQAGSVVTIVLGAPSGAMGTQTTAAAMTWTPNASAYDAAGNASSTAVATESGASDVEF